MNNYFQAREQKSLRDKFLQVQKPAMLLRRQIRAQSFKAKIKKQKYFPTANEIHLSQNDISDGNYISTQNYTNDDQFQKFQQELEKEYEIIKEQYTPQTESSDMCPRHKVNEYLQSYWFNKIYIRRSNLKNLKINQARVQTKQDSDQDKIIRQSAYELLKNFNSSSGESKLIMQVIKKKVYFLKQAERPKFNLQQSNLQALKARHYFQRSAQIDTTNQNVQRINSERLQEQKFIKKGSIPNDKVFSTIQINQQGDKINNRHQYQAQDQSQDQQTNKSRRINNEIYPLERNEPENSQLNENNVLQAQITKKDTKRMESKRPLTFTDISQRERSPLEQKFHQNTYQTEFPFDQNQDIPYRNQTVKSNQFNRKKILTKANDVAICKKLIENCKFFTKEDLSQQINTSGEISQKQRPFTTESYILSQPIKNLNNFYEELKSNNNDSQNIIGFDHMKPFAYRPYQIPLDILKRIQDDIESTEKDQVRKSLSVRVNKRSHEFVSNQRFFSNGYQ